MPPRRIELVRLAGTHREVGFQIGSATAEVVRRHAGAIEAGRLAQADAYRDVTAAELPWLVEEPEGVAAGADADPLALFAASIEEIAVEEPAPASRCSDLVATAPATPDGHVWAAHTNHFLGTLPGGLIDTLRRDWPDTEARLARASAALAESPTEE